MMIIIIGTSEDGSPTSAAGPVAACDWLQQRDHTWSKYRVVADNVLLQLGAPEFNVFLQLFLDACFTDLASLLADE